MVMIANVYFVQLDITLISKPLGRHLAILHCLGRPT